MATARAVAVADGFLGRWSQRKQALREGRVVAESPVGKTATRDEPAAHGVTETSNLQPSENQPASAAPQPLSAQPPAPTPTLADVQALHANSSYAPFVARDVAPEVRNAAMKKLFTDPHYNVMDGLDIYIDDYSVPSPMPAAMLRQMASAKFLKLFDDDEPPATQAPAEPSLPRAEPSPAELDVVATRNRGPQQVPALNSTQNPHHDHTDLRLQPDDAARPTRPECEPERAPDPAFEPVPPPSR
ncbi:MAG: DUF3306 domain-containing protein [Rhodoferax sp.]|nr:DUF3306 domain-containing protein [Rhodoferax sp.]